jgi:hypothetical protein
MGRAEHSYIRAAGWTTSGESVQGVPARTANVHQQNIWRGAKQHPDTPLKIPIIRYNFSLLPNATVTAVMIASTFVQVVGEAVRGG